MAKAKPKGMRFSTKGVRVGIVPPEYRRTDEPFPKKGLPVIFRAPNIQYHGAPLQFTGLIHIDDPEVAVKLMKWERSYLEFNPQEAVDILGIPAQQVRDLGYEVNDAVAEEEKAPVEEAPAPAPDLNTMSIPELRKYADGNKIFVPEKMHKDDMVKFVKKQLKKKGSR